jgi:hypothetical protein
VLTLYKGRVLGIAFQHPSMLGYQEWLKKKLEQNNVETILRVRKGGGRLWVDTVHGYEADDAQETRELEWIIMLLVTLSPEDHCEDHFTI